MRVAFHTLGCKVNQYETEAIREAFVRKGAEIVDENDVADVYVINTCTVTGIADRKSRQYIRRIKGVNPQALTVVTGCYAQVAPDEVSSLDGVDMVIGNNLKGEIVARVYAALDKAGVCGGTCTRAVETDVLAYDELVGYEDMGIVTASESPMCRAYIKIEEGCNRFCSYCMIPFARGRVRSRAPQEIVREAEALLAQGYKELVLTGINTALYGSEPEFAFDRAADEEAMTGLEVIIKRLNDIDLDFRIRLSSLEPTVVDKERVEQLLGYDKLCHHLHLSIQSGSDAVLTAMNRHYTAAEYLEIVESLKSFDPLYGITTDIIAGFPGETENDHEETLSLIGKAGFARVHVFRFSPRKGTKAAGMSGAVDGRIKSRRAQELSAAAERELDGFIERNKQATHRVLIEERAGDFATGYTGNYIKVYVRDSGGELPIGEFCDVEITDRYKDGAIGVPGKEI